jgi:uncharacterized protein
MANYWFGKLALVTGASGGIGENIAVYLARQGCRVILVARRLEKLNAVAARIKEFGGQAFIVQADLGRAADRVALYNKVITDLGIPDILVNNAGIGWYGYFSKMPWEVANEILQLNITAVTHLTSLFLPRMLELPKARIINIGSVAGKLPEQGIALYSASKAYMDAFTTSVYRDLRGTNVSVSVVRAGPVKTEFYDRAINQPSGGKVPGEFFAVPAERISRQVWNLVLHSQRYKYVPFYLFVSPLLETFFSWALDLVGPILLRGSEKKTT